MRSRRRMETSQKYPEAQRKRTNLFFSLTEVWCLPAPSATKPEEGKFVVDSGASMHMLSRKDLNAAELENARVWKSPTTVVTASGEVQTNEEATMYVKEFDLFVTLKLLEHTSTLTRRILRRTRKLQRVDQWYVTTPHKKWQTDTVQHGKLRSDCGPWLIDRLFQLDYTYISNIVITGSQIASSTSTGRPVARTSRNRKKS